MELGELDDLRLEVYLKSVCEQMLFSFLSIILLKRYLLSRREAVFILDTGSNSSSGTTLNQDSNNSRKFQVFSNLESCDAFLCPSINISTSLDKQLNYLWESGFSSTV